VILFGPAAELGAAPGVEVVDAPVSIAKTADPVRAVRSTPEASVVQAVQSVADGRADALVAGGSTGAALAAGLFHIKRAGGIHRPALAVLIPVPGRPLLLLDCGANVEVRPEHLVQFAHMGAAFMEAVMGVSGPRVALLSNGEEATRGTADVMAAHAALSDAPELAFAGNVEGFTFGAKEVDVVVADGFTGNVALKVMEGTSDALLREVRDAVDPEEQGGAFLLGLRKLAVVPHGSFSARGVARAIELAARGVTADVVARTHERLEAAGALRAAPPAASEPVGTVPEP
jgi:glycerol-3-phosphate acyltransferase PlsX